MSERCPMPDCPECKALRDLVRRVVKTLPRPWIDGGVTWKKWADTLDEVDKLAE